MLERFRTAQIKDKDLNLNWETSPEWFWPLQHWILLPRFWDTGWLLPAINFKCFCFPDLSNMLGILVLYVVYSIHWLYCKAWLHVCYCSSSNVALDLHQHIIWSQSKFHLCYLHQTSSHNFLCHKHAIIPQKRFHFHFLGHKHVQTILAKSLLSDASVACCFHYILEDSRILFRTAILFEKLYEDMHLMISFSRM